MTWVIALAVGMIMAVVLILFAVAMPRFKVLDVYKRQDLDLVLGNDITSPVAIHEMDKFKKDGVFDKEKIALVMDHFRCV